MSITWNASIPQPADAVSTSQGQLLDNNKAIAAVFNDVTNGIFTKYLLQNVGTLASLVDPVSALHAQNGTGANFTGHPVPYFKNSVGDFPLMPDVTGTTSAFFFQLGKVLVYFGYVTLSGTSATISFSTNYTNGNTYTILATAADSTAISPYVTRTNSASAVINGGNGHAYTYIAIGY